jgi:quercetin dioxygenase-like cupin family protein
MKRYPKMALAILFLSPAIGSAQDAARVQPQSYHVVLENEQVRVLEYNAKPGMGVCGVGMHSHPAHVTVLLSPQKVRIRLPNGQVMEHSGKPGDAFYEPPVTHEVENVSGVDARTLIIELKPQKTGR